MKRLEKTKKKVLYQQFEKEINNAYEKIFGSKKDNWIEKKNRAIVFSTVAEKLINEAKAVIQQELK